MFGSFEVSVHVPVATHLRLKRFGPQLLMRAFSRLDGTPYAVRHNEKLCLDTLLISRTDQHPDGELPLRRTRLVRLLDHGHTRG